MRLPRLTNNNAIELLKKQNIIPQTRTAKNNREFFKFLKEKVSRDFNKMLDAEDIDKKIDFLADLYGDIDTYKSMLQKNAPDIDKKMRERNNKVGGLDKRIILEATEKKIIPKWTEDDYQFVKKEGEESGYPVVNIGRNEDNRVYMKSLPGKESWEKQMKTRLSEETEDHFIQFISAVRKKDYDTEIQK